MGLPREGPGSVAGYGRRLGSLVIDWFIALLVAAAVAAALHASTQTRSLLTLLVFGVMAWLLIGLTGTTVGKRLCGLRVVRPGGGRVGLLWAFVRTLLLVLVVPALIWDRDYRGLHDRAANSVVVRR
ncbi:MAG: RDD family protein [Actinoallomurus sp.]